MAPGNRIAEWLSKTVQIPSVNPAYPGPRAGELGEEGLATRLAEWFEGLGGEVHTEEVLPGRPNVYGIWRGKSERWALVDVHTDTVGVEHMTGDPFSGRIEDGRVYGRGAVDTKATLGVVLALLEAIHQSGSTPEVNLLIAGTADEEHGATGALTFANWVRERRIPMDQLVVAEPTMCSPVYAHKCALRLEFQVEGVSSHASKPLPGKNPITAASRLALALEEEHDRLQSGPPQTELGAPTLAVTTIHAGRGLNVVPDSCSLAIDRRMVPGEKASEVKVALQELAQRSCPLPVTVRVLQQFEPFYQSPDTPWVRHLCEWSGMEPSVVPFGTNAFAYVGLAQECIVIGPGSIDQAHGEVEWVEISELEKLAGIFQHWWGIPL